MKVSEIKEKRQQLESVILFAGATSFLGCRIAIDYLQKGFHVIFLIRSKNGEPPKERIASLFSVWGYHELNKANVTILNAQLEKPNLGLNNQDYMYIVQHTSEIVHSAANTDMEEEKKEEVQRFNIESTRNLLKVATSGTAYYFHFMSTSYSCGTREGVIKESFIPHNQYYNPYEESKHIAERLIIETCHEAGIKYHIIRPSIVYGDSKTGVASRFNAFYYFIRTLDYLKNIYMKDFEKAGIRSRELGIYRTSEGELHIPLRIEIKKDSFFNIIPIDYFVDVTKTILEDSFESRIYHVVNTKPTLLQATLDNFCKLNRIKGLYAVPEEIFAQKEPNVIEKLYQEYMDIYRPYFRDTKTFDDTNTQLLIAQKGIVPAQLCDETVFNRCIEFARKVKYGKFLHKYIAETTQPDTVS